MNDELEVGWIGPVVVGVLLGLTLGALIGAVLAVMLGSTFFMYLGMAVTGFVATFGARSQFEGRARQRLVQDAILDDYRGRKAATAGGSELAPANRCPQCRTALSSNLLRPDGRFDCPTCQTAVSA